ncbi:hypothetical protein LWI29_016537 [Acer saccharum]|uniref:MULE transposase domain-containing protein n=1 Tax=Acer saccharum TaxID=4024 RepID=A0AA39RDB0_ACESA|nr:hypothetical protein LWI29_016537 [Acer saccharum]
MPHKLALPTREAGMEKSAINRNLGAQVSKISDNCEIEVIQKCVARDLAISFGKEYSNFVKGSDVISANIKGLVGHTELGPKVVGQAGDRSAMVVEKGLILPKVASKLDEEAVDDIAKLTVKNKLGGPKTRKWKRWARDGAHLDNRIEAETQAGKRGHGGQVDQSFNKDGNEMIYPLAFRFANSECSKSWTWFLKQLHDVILHPELVLIVSDRHTGISNGMRAIFPNSAHVLCAYHLANNLKQHCRKRGDMIYHYYRAAYAYRVEKFDRVMAELKSIHPKVYDELVEVGMQKFSCVHSPRKRYHMMTTNIAESMNSCLLAIRKLPITSIAEFIRDLLQRWFHDRRRKLSNASMSSTKDNTQLGMAVRASSIPKNWDTINRYPIFNASSPSEGFVSRLKVASNSSIDGFSSTK